MIEQYITQISDYIQAHPYIGEFITFLIAFAESLPLIGTIIPGSITMTAIGILVGRDILPMILTLFFASIGALVGDIIGFGFGKYYKDRLRDMWPFKKRPHWLLMGEKFFLKHGGKSVLLGRFVGPARSSIPLLAGLLNMSWSKFIMAAIPSAVLWALLYMVPGVILGTISLALPKEKATTFTLIGLAIIVGLWLIFWVIQRFFIFSLNKFNASIDRVWNWLNHHHASKPIIKLITNQRYPSDHYQIMRVFLALISLLLFFFIYFSVTFQVGIYHLNEPFFNLIQTLRNQTWDKVFALITEFGDKYMLTLSTILVAIFFAIRRDWYTFWHVLTLTFITFALVFLFKNVYYSERPTGFMVVSTNSSLPSGHSTESLAILGFFTFLIARALPKKLRAIPYTLISLLVLAVIISRLYLGAHWLCDVLAGTFLALFILLLYITSYHRKDPKPLKPALICPILLFILVPWGIFAYSMLHKNLSRYTPINPQQTINLNQWWQNPTNYTPLYRLNRLGFPQQPFNIQWADSPTKIKTFLIHAGWKDKQDTKTLKKIFARFASKSPEQQIAFLRQLYEQKPPVLFFIKTIPNENKIIELRLWRTSIRFKGTSTKLLLGSFNYHKPATSYFSLKPHLQISLKNGGGIKTLTATINDVYDWRIIKPTSTTIPSKLDYLNWDKSILIIRNVTAQPSG